MRYFLYLFGVFLQVTPHLAEAQISARFKNFTYDDHITSVESFVLGRTCFSLRASQMNLDCNPAFQADSQQRRVGIQATVDNDVFDAFKFVDELRHNDSSGYINRILSDQRPFAVHEVANLYGQYDWFTVVYTPLRLGIASVVLNPPYPKITTHALSQSELSLRGGFFFSDNSKLRFGGNLRYVREHQIRDEFDLFDAIANPNSIRIQEADRLYFDPAVSYLWEGSWEAEFSFALTHLALYQSDGSGLLDDGPRPELGLSSRPDVWGGKLRTSLHFTGRPDVERTTWRLRFGGIYEFDNDLSMQFSLAGEEYGVGVMTKIDSLILGLGVRTEMLFHNGQEIDRITSALFQAGLTF